MDKQFVIAFPLGTDDAPSLVEVIGQEFPGLDASEQRAVRLVVPQFVGTSMGAWVGCLLRWAFDSTHELIRYGGPLRFV